MLKKLVFISILFTLCLGLVSRPALADGIQNPSFEAINPLTSPCTGPEVCAYNFGPIPGWTITGSGGSWQPSSHYLNLPLSDGGSIVAFSNGGTISQMLTGTSLLANTSYALSVFIGNRLDGLNNTYTIAVDSGSTELCSFSGSSASIAPGTFADKTCSFQSGSVPLGDLSIILTSGGTQVDFDNVRLTTSVPEPSSVLLTGFGLLFALILLTYSKRKKLLLARLT